MRTLAIVIAALAVSAGGGVASSATATTEQASRIFDRTLICSPLLIGGIYKVGVWGNSTSPSNEGRAFVTTGGPPHRPLLALGERYAYVAVACGKSAARVDLGTRGLVGGAVPQTPEAIDCWTPRRVLVRVRAVFERSYSVGRTEPGLLYASGRVIEGSFAVQTQSGKRIAVGRILKTGKVQIYTDRRGECFPD